VLGEGRPPGRQPGHWDCADGGRDPVPADRPHLSCLSYFCVGGNSPYRVWNEHAQGELTDGDEGRRGFVNKLHIIYKICRVGPRMGV